MDLSHYLARVIGLYVIITCIAILVNPRRVLRVLNEFLDSSALLLYAGMVTLILGLLLVVGHNVWEWSGAVIVTIVGWLTLIKGFFLLYFPKEYSKFGRWYLLGNRYIANVVISLLVGIYLLYYGFFF